MFCRDGYPMDSFIGIYDDALEPHICELLISQFELHEQHEGLFMKQGEPVVDKSIKQCIEIKDRYFSRRDIISNMIRPSLVNCINQYNQKYNSYLNTLYSWFYDDSYTFQKLVEKDDGYKVWHCEHGMDNISSQRLMAWMFYLNDASGTEFMNYPTVEAKTGRCIIWPSGWTHTHRSELPNKCIKYIISGWISFKKHN